MKLLIVPIAAIIIVALICFVVTQTIKRLRPTQPNTELEHMRHLLIEIQAREELLPSLPASTKHEIDIVLNNRRYK